MQAYLLYLKDTPTEGTGVHSIYVLASSKAAARVKAAAYDTNTDDTIWLSDTYTACEETIWLYGFGANDIGGTSEYGL